MALDRILDEIIHPIDYNSLEQALIGTGWSGSGWDVTDRDTTYGISVSAGSGFTGRGSRVVTTSNTNVTVTAAHSTLPRKDLLIWDRSAGSFAIIDGTAAVIEPEETLETSTGVRLMTSPAPPVLSDSTDIVIATLYIPAGATLGSDIIITDKKVKVPSLGSDLVFDDTYSNKQGTTEATIKSFRINKTSTFSYQSLIFQIGLWSSSSSYTTTLYIEDESQANLIVGTNPITTNATTETFFEVVCDISGLSEGIHTINIRTKSSSSSGYARQQYLQVWGAL